MIRILVLNGPNLNLLGQREPSVYGTDTLADVEAMLREAATRLGVEIAFRQSNHEGELVDAVQGAAAGFDGLIVNLGAYTHTSLALRDAFLAAPLPFVEVHISNLFRREAARHHSLVADLAVGMITGLGTRGYLLALDGLVAALRDG
ncbi:MAG: type II 3-dehydroquinate dehydratase [Gemmatimonadetes bacterium]|nr:type II 3-dehydroquinate dehydratase [Gemmatimonadota bacterium]MCB9505667.1 type II 3-dehydroquinate dehydratase [Gemmatimonadales bacterium]MCA9768336.1 type II 3-dehydroquinate dehydratase [Gemmatimonadota bacterium]MCB9517343.1 type II 3-dehydroquinate dehydratase [Gemmatimonadales bacterium]HPF60419.1 type II 3-dehydroquinate dehydratase [Gemmatimonadales bacterium]